MGDRHIATIQKNAREEIRVSLTTYNGHRLFNVRVWFEADSGEMRPGKSGVAFRVDRLQEFAEAVIQARDAASVE